jgi:predicted nucleic acid-binding Zn finger protein
MQGTLEQAGGQYAVYSESGNTYTVDIVEGTCSCPEYHENKPNNDCKHRRRVEMEI